MNFLLPFVSSFTANTPTLFYIQVKYLLRANTINLPKKKRKRKKMSKNTNKDSGPKKSLFGNYRKPFWFNFFAQV